MRATMLAILLAVLGGAAAGPLERAYGLPRAIVAIVLGLAIGALRARLVKSFDDRPIANVAALIALFGLTFGEAMSTELGGFSEVTGWTVFGWGVGILAAWGLPVRRVAMLERRHDAARYAELATMRGVSDEAPVPVQTARIMCAICESLVDAGSTTSTPKGIACRECYEYQARSHTCAECDVAIDGGVARGDGNTTLCARCFQRVRRLRVARAGVIQCDVCGESVSTNNTAAYEEHSVVCLGCVDQLEAGPNRNATFR